MAAAGRADGLGAWAAVALPNAASKKARWAAVRAGPAGAAPAWGAGGNGGRMVVTGGGYG
jgi:hypothetical protein